MSITVKLAISLCLAVLLSLGKEVRMAVYNVIPARFTNLDIRDTLNANGGSVGDNSSDYFGVRANVNIFSLKKPVKFNKQFVTEPMPGGKLIMGISVSSSLRPVLSRLWAPPCLLGHGIFPAVAAVR